MSLQNYDIVLAVILAEAIVNLIFYGTILQPLREWIIKYIPLRVRDEHLLECKLCTSVWVGLLCVILVKHTMGVTIIAVVLWGIIIHRISNYLHLLISIVRDKQLDMRVQRRKIC